MTGRWGRCSWRGCRRRRRSGCRWRGRRGPGCRCRTGPCRAAAHGLWRVFSSAYLGDFWRRDDADNLVVIAWTTTAHTSIVMPTIFGYGPFISAALVSKAAKKNAIAIAVLTMMTDRLGLPTKVRGLHLCLPGRRLMGITTP